ncbi:uncharacterized protein LOC127749743 [Frankliniella occidentalis]|uniref:Uncharacterized protein LOC127749743 n=1 Tax=Frankliniella occidentalis TaxID=133901 RepID=A0A9C6UDS5_FRAOC|nr:uncharacterized protein LOC127749743 [Frankliniella occidentalis]
MESSFDSSAIRQSRQGLMHPTLVPLGILMVISLQLNTGIAEHSRIRHSTVDTSRFSLTTQGEMIAGPRCRSNMSIRTRHHLGALSPPVGVGSHLEVHFRSALILVRSRHLSRGLTHPYLADLLGPPDASVWVLHFRRADIRSRLSGCHIADRRT